MRVDQGELRRANRRMQQRRRTQPHALSARYDRSRSRIVVALSTGIELAFPVDLAQGLAGAKAADLGKIEISPSGFGLHWPRLDADLYLPTLIEGIFGTRRWMAQLMGKAGGHATSPAKRAAARANGRLGGRPRKHAPITR